jgi:hypothetical protein
MYSFVAARTGPAVAATWIFCPRTMIAPRTIPLRLTTHGLGRRDTNVVPGPPSRCPRAGFRTRNRSLLRSVRHESTATLAIELVRFRLIMDT